MIKIFQPCVELTSANGGKFWEGIDTPLCFTYADAMQEMIKYCAAHPDWVKQGFRIDESVWVQSESVDI